MLERDAAIQAVAVGQRGHFTRHQALAVGFTDPMIRRRVSTGAWVVAHRGIYRFPAVSTRQFSEAEVGALCVPGGVVSHQSAGRHHGFPAMGSRPITLTVPSGTTHCFTGIIVHESTDLSASDCIDVDGVTYTSAIRSLIDLAAVLKPVPLRHLCQDLTAGKVIDPSATSTRLEELARRGKPGVRALRAILAELVPAPELAESAFEVEVIQLLAAEGLPTPELQAALPWRSSLRGRVDLLFREAKVIIECDGRRWHTRERDFERDRRRDNEAMLAGWRVYRITWTELRANPGRIIREVAMLLGIVPLAVA